MWDSCPPSCWPGLDIWNLFVIKPGNDQEKKSVIKFQNDHENKEMKQWEMWWRHLFLDAFKILKNSTCKRSFSLLNVFCLSFLDWFFCSKKYHHREVYSVYFAKVASKCAAFEFSWLCSPIENLEICQWVCSLQLCLAFLLLTKQI